MKTLIAITRPEFFPQEGKIISRLFEAGLQRLHIRKPGCTVSDLQALLNDISSVHHPRLVLHDRFELAVDPSYGYAVSGIHINRRNPSIPDGYAGAVSRSCHTWEEIRKSGTYRYVFLSPVFQSISKEGYAAGFSVEELEKAASQGYIHERVIALGGLSPTTIPLIRDLPFGGFAVLGSLWGNHPESETSDSIIDRYKRLETCL